MFEKNENKQNKRVLLFIVEMRGLEPRSSFIFSYSSDFSFFLANV